MKKKVLKAITIAILLFIGLITLGFVYLFIPGTSLFGVTFLGQATAKASKGYNMAEVSTFEFSSSNFNISVEEVDKSEISVAVYSKVYGLVLVKNSKIVITESLNDGVLKIDVEEPHGLVTYRDSIIKVNIPKTSNLNLILKNNSSSVTINNNLSFKDFDYISESGTCNLISCSISGTLNLNLNKSIFNIGEKANINSNDVKLKLSTGKFNASKKNFNSIEILENSRGMITINRCDNLEGNFSSAGGKIEANQVENINLVSSDTNIVINESINKSSSIKLTNSGSVNIANVKSECFVLTKSGNVKIEKTEMENYTNILSVQTSSGSITIKNANCIIDASSKSGNIDVKYDDTCERYSGNILNYESAYPVRRNLFVSTESGKITASGLEKITLTISGKGSADINMLNVIGSNNSIIAKSGSVNVKFSAEGTKAFKLTTKTTGSASVNYAAYTTIGGSTKQDETYNIYYGYETMPSTTNLIKIESSGSIKVRDTVTENY